MDEDGSVKVVERPRQSEPNIGTACQNGVSSITQAPRQGAPTVTMQLTTVVVTACESAAS
jgi:hypothetical protein